MERTICSRFFELTSQLNDSPLRPSRRGCTLDSCEAQWITGYTVAQAANGVPTGQDQIREVQHHDGTGRFCVDQLAHVILMCGDLGDGKRPFFWIKRGKPDPAAISLGVRGGK